MKKWKYTLKNGIALREAIDKEDMKRVLEILLDCYDEIMNYFVKEGYTEPEDRNYEYENYTEDIIMELNSEEYDEDLINWLLSEFYDLCDIYNIWVAL